MIQKIIPGQRRKTLSCDVAGQYPIYIYWPKGKESVIYSCSITELLDDNHVPKPLVISNDSLSFLLQAGVVPPPKTIYEEVYILSIGDQAEVFTKGGKVEVEFKNSFVFGNRNLPIESDPPDENLFLERLANATAKGVNESRPAFLFHSAGKDSNSIAIALAEAGWQDKVTLVTHKSKGPADESVISRKIAKNLGFEHVVLNEPNGLSPSHYEAMARMFSFAPLPCTDNVSLAYPFYTVELPELIQSNIIDGMGNDVYLGHIPSSSELKKQKLSKALRLFKPINKSIGSASYLSRVYRSKIALAGAGGFTYSDCRKIMKGRAQDIDFSLRDYGFKDDYLDFRAAFRGVVVDQEISIRKVRNFSDAFGCTLTLPFTDESVVNFFRNIEEKYLFDRSTLKNKVFLRGVLKKYLEIDSDEIGKKSFSFDSKSVVIRDWDFIRFEISKCALWSPGVLGVVDKLWRQVNKRSRYSELPARLIYRLFLISSWYNNCVYTGSVPSSFDSSIR